jgi:hypothetical protein
MVTSRAEAVDDYLAELPDERRSALLQVRKLIRKHLPRGFQETMQYGMISYVIPLKRYPETYNGQPLAVIALAAQKQYMSIYLMGIYGSPQLRADFETAYAKSGKRLDAGKSCVRFKQLDDLALDAVATAVSRVSVEDLIAMTEAAHGSKRKPKPAAPKKPKPSAKKPSSKRTPS